MAHASRLLIVLVLLTGCGDPSGPVPPPDAVPLEPVPAEYAGWWSLVERCAGVQSDMGRVGWLVTPGSTVTGTRGATGAWYGRTNQIVLAAERAAHGDLVRHEMLHAILLRTAHPRTQFLEKCGEIVRCAGHCVEQAGGPVLRDTAAVIVDASTLRVTVDLEPRTVSVASLTKGCVTVVVAASNTAATPVRVLLQQVPGTSAYDGFGWSLDGFRAGVARGPDAALLFAAREVRRHVFECVFVGPAAGQSSPQPGTHTVRGRLLGMLSEPATLTIVP